MFEKPSAAESIRQDCNLFRIKCSAVSREVLARGFKLSHPSFESIAKFETKSPTIRREILNYLERFLSGLREFPNLHSAGLLSPGEERVFLQRHLWRTDTRFGDESFFDRIDSGDIVEIYNLDGIQIYRSWSCFEVCSYSLSDLLMYDWDVLYERPSSIVKKINEKIIEAVASPTCSFAYNLPAYLMYEKFDGHDNRINFEMKHVVSIVDRKTGVPVAVCSTGRAELWEAPGCNLSFL